MSCTAGESNSPPDPSRSSATVERVEIAADVLVALRQAAERGRALHYAPYSDFVVLAAARTIAGAIGGGSNVENVNFSLTKHAEEVAILAALQIGGEPPRPGVVDIVYVAGAMPCGSCRQFALEFGSTDALWLVDLVPQDLLREQSLLELAPSPELTMTFGEALPLAFDAAVTSVRGAGRATMR